MDEETDEDGFLDIRLRLARLRELHEDLSVAVAAIQDMPQPDQIQLARLKKRKLLLKDQIAQLASLLTPDLIA
jgi:hypothetical protein